MSTRNRNKGQKKSNIKNKNRKRSNAHNTNQKKEKQINNTDKIAEMAELKDKIAEMAELKDESDEDENEYYESHHYLDINRKLMSDAKFTKIDCLSENEIVPLKQQTMQNPINKEIKDNIIERLRERQYKIWLIELKTGFNLLFYGVGSKKK
eukprot:200143_1